MWRWEDVKMRRCEDEKMWRLEGVKMRRCEDEKMWRWEDVKMRRCEDEKMWRWEGVKMRRCEDEKMRYRPPLLEEPCAQTLSGKNTRGSDHFRRFRCRKSARRCGAKHILKSKCKKHQGVRTTFGGSDVASLRFASLHYTTLHYTPQHYNYKYTTTLHYTPLH